jgi:hypothetical protein
LTPFKLAIAVATVGITGYRRYVGLFSLICRIEKEMADYVAAINIAAKAWSRAAVKQPIVEETLISTYKPPILIGGS